MHEIASLATHNFKIFGGLYPRTLIGWLAPSDESGFALFMPPTMLYWTPAKSSAKNPDQISGGRSPRVRYRLDL